MENPMEEVKNGISKLKDELNTKMASIGGR